MCMKCEVLEVERAARHTEPAGLQVVRVHPEADVREVTL